VTVQHGMSHQDAEIADWTIGRLLTWTTEYLKRHGSESPRLDAEVLLAAVRRCERIELYTSYGETATEEQRARFRTLVQRRARHEPVAYLVGRKEFFSLSFCVTPDVLVPRPETEFVVTSLADLTRQDPKQASQIADVGTGSGILAVCAAKQLPQSRVLALDLSPAALEVARRNATEHGVLDRIELQESDLFSRVSPERKFDFVLSNPPYVAEGEISTLPPDVRDYEPRMALVAGVTGTEIIERLLVECRDRLRIGGWLLMEISPRVAERVLELAAKCAAYQAGGVVRDAAGQPRVVRLQRV
jgi:release factor glutamine methyltransferase